MDIEQHPEASLALERLPSLDDEARHAFLAACRAQTFRRGDYLIRAGSRQRELHFIVDGLVRFVYLAPSGKEFNKSFAGEGAFIGCLRSMLTAMPCRFSIEALESTQTLCLSHDRRLELLQRYPQWEQMARRLAEQLALKKEAREAEFLLDSAETRYRNFLTEHPRLAERIPQYHIASYLGITDVALSRIRKKMRET